MTIKQRRAAYIKRQQAIVDGAKALKRELTEEEQAEFEKLQSAIDTLQEIIEDEDPSDDESREDSDEDDDEDDDESRSDNEDGEGDTENEDKRSAGKGKQRAAAQRERQRSSQITKLCRSFGVEPDKYISDGTSVADVQKDILERLKRERQGVSPSAAGSGEDRFRADASTAILLRSGMPVKDAGAGAEKMRHFSLRDLAVECLIRSGDHNARSLSSDELFSLMQRQAFNPTNAFSAILDATINKAYVEGYNKVPVTFDKWTAEGTLKDFKTVEHNYYQGIAGELLEVPENGELQHDTFDDTLLPTRKLKTYGRQFTMSRQAFINDDIGFLTTLPAKYAESSRKTINKQVYNIVMKNAIISDGTPLFSEDHGNLISAGAAPSFSSIQGMLNKLLLQKDVNGDPIYITPRFIIVPVGWGMLVQQAFATPTINIGDTVFTPAANPLYNYKHPIEIIEDPTLNVYNINPGTTVVPWFMAADPLSAPTIQVDYLNGQKIPTLRRMEVAGTLGFVWDVYLDWGITTMDYRGIIKNAGATLA